MADNREYAVVSLLKGTGMVKKYIVSLSESERQTLDQMVATGTRSASIMNHARILLKADTQHPSGGWRDPAIREA